MSIKLICASHTPLMDHVETDPEIDGAVRAQFSGLAKQVAEYDPELVVIFAPDHFKCVFYDMMPPFTVGIRAEAIGDYDIGGGTLNVPEALAEDLVKSVHQSGVDVASSYRLSVDHGFSQMLDLLKIDKAGYPVIPIHVNCAGTPLAPMARIRAMGKAVGDWARQQNIRVLVLGSGGLSHDPPIPTLKGAPADIAEKLISGHKPTLDERRAREQDNFVAARALARGEGHTLDLNADWDREFMHRMSAGDLQYLDDLSESDITQTAGCGGHEVRNWLAAYAALSAFGDYTSQELIYHDISEWNAGMGISVAEPVADLNTAQQFRS